MTRADLLAYLLGSGDRTPQKLTKVFGREWAEPMRSLIDLGIVILHEHGNTRAVYFYVAGWKGKNDSPTYSHQAVTRQKEAV